MARSYNTVAVVEDDQDIRLVLREALEDEGYTVVEAGTGPAGLAGTGLLRAVVADETLRRHRYIICTASPKTNPGRQALRMQLGAPLLGKPFDVDALLRLVADVAATLP